MLLMVIERFTRDHTALIRERFTTQRRMLPDDVEYLGSWIDPEGPRCFQLMEAPAANSLEPWMRRWNDLVDFEVIPVLSSAEFWARFQIQRAKERSALLEGSPVSEEFTERVEKLPVQKRT